MVKDSSLLRQHYLKTKAWRYDLASLIPTDIAYYWWRPGTCDDVSSLLHVYLVDALILVRINKKCPTLSFFNFVIAVCQYWLCSRNVYHAL